MTEGLASDIRSALVADAAAQKLFTSLAPSHRQEYLRWVEEAKKPDTRARRIAAMLERLKA